MVMLEVDVNGEEVFFVDKGVFSSSCNLLKKLFTKETDEASTKTLKIIFRDFPGGAVGFELFSRFCYNTGGVVVTPANTCLLHCAARFMEMTEGPSLLNLIKKTEKSMEGITYWSWLDIVAALKQCQECFLDANHSGILDKLLESLVGRIVSGNDTSPTSSSSPESSAFRFSFDTRSTLSTKHIVSRSWWFEDLAVMNHKMVEKIVKAMVAHKLDHVIISRFLFYYLRSGVVASSIDKKKSTELVVDLLYCLDRTLVSCRGLFGVLRVCSCLKVSKSCQDRIESMIGSQLDQATLDNLLIPSPAGMDSLYDVNIIIRFLKSFVGYGVQVSIPQLKRVANLMDLYLAEVAPDSSLKPSKFVGLITALPDAARDSYDSVYRAIDMYLEVHNRLPEEVKMKICCVINYKKLSTESLQHLAKNSKFPSRTAIQAIVSQHSMLKSILHETNSFGKLNAPLPKEKLRRNYDEQIVLYAKKLDLSTENEKLKCHLQGMQSRVIELEKTCRKMQEQIAKAMKPKISSPSGPRTLPRLCS